jgi:hypothetical protein
LWCGKCQTGSVVTVQSQSEFGTIKIKFLVFCLRAIKLASLTFSLPYLWSIYACHKLLILLKISFILVIYWDKKPLSCYFTIWTQHLKNQIFSLKAWWIYNTIQYYDYLPLFKFLKKHFPQWLLLIQLFAFNCYILKLLSILNNKENLDNFLTYLKCVCKFRINRNKSENTEV